MRAKYEHDIRCFGQLVSTSSSSAELLSRIRSVNIPADRRMTLLKIFRRCVSGVCDTEATKKVKKITTQSIVDAYGHTFKPISKLKAQFADLRGETIAIIAVLIGEYDSRGQQGYMLAGLFFDWFEDKFKGKLTIVGPRGAGPDVELSTVVDDFTGSCPCDFVIHDIARAEVTALGFARYDSTRGGAQSDDRTGGNTAKVYMIRDYCHKHRRTIRIVFLADGPGLAHRDTWKEACELDCMWDDNVRVATLKLVDTRLTLDWLRGK
jgi:hypothetical protein